MQFMTLLLPLGIWLAMHRETLDMHIPTMKLGRTNVILITALSFFLLPYMALVSGVTALFFPNPASDFLSGAAQHSLLALLFAGAVTPAVVEEVVFRGYIQSQYPGRPFWFVAFLNGLFFGIIHWHPQQFPYAFAMGIILAYFVYFTRSIRAGILSHFIVNAFNILMFRGMSFLMEAEETRLREAGDPEALAEWEAALTAAAKASPWSAFFILFVVALVFFPFIFFLFRALISHNRQRMTTYDIKQALVTPENEESEDKPEDVV